MQPNRFHGEQALMPSEILCATKTSNDGPSWAKGTYDGKVDRNKPQSFLKSRSPDTAGVHSAPLLKNGHEMR